MGFTAQHGLNPRGPRASPLNERLDAAKEAAMKALGTGHSRGVFWTGIEVVRRHGPPQIRFHGGAAARAAQMGATGSLLTITHSRELAIAHVLLIRE